MAAPKPISRPRQRRRQADLRQAHRPLPLRHQARRRSARAPGHPRHQHLQHTLREGIRQPLPEFLSRQRLRNGRRREPAQRQAHQPEPVQLRPLQDLRHRRPVPDHHLGARRKAAAARITTGCDSCGHPDAERGILRVQVAKARVANGLPRPSSRCKRDGTCVERHCAYPVTRCANMQV